MKTSIYIKTKKLIAAFAIMAMTASTFGSLNEAFGWQPDTLSPVISFTPLSSPLRQSAVPADLELTITDDVGVVSVISDNLGITGALIGSGSKYQLPLSSEIGSHEYIVTATDAASNSNSATISYNVISDSMIKSIVVTPASPTISSGATLQLTAVAKDQSGSVISPDPVFTWTTNRSGIVKVSSSGLITGISAGTGIISAKSNGITGKVTVVVTAANGGGDTTPPTISFTPLSSPIMQSLVPGSMVFDISDDVGVVSSSFSESGTTSSGILSETGGLAGLSIPNSLGEHIFEITARDAAGNIGTAIFSYVVIPDSQTGSISITPANPTINSGSSLQLMAEARDQSGSIISPAPEFTWNSENIGVVTVSTGGLIRGIAAGTGMISVTGNGLSGSTVVTVSDSSTGDTLPPGISYIGIPSVIKQSEVPEILPLTVTDDVGIASVIFSHEGSTGTLVGSGEIYPLALSDEIMLHEYLITATDTSGNTTSTSISYTVIADSGISIIITPANPTINSGVSLQLTASALDESGSVIAPAPMFTWSSSNSGIVAVSTGGLIRGISVGTASVSATSSGMTGTAIVTVTSPSGGGDTIPPVITFSGISSPIKQSLVPANISLTVTDNVGIVSLVTYENGAGSGTLVSPSGSYIMAISNELGLHNYVVTARDAAGNSTSATFTYTVITDVDTTAPVISYSPLADIYNQAAVPAYIPLTVTDDVGVASVIYSESGTNNTGPLSGSGDIYNMNLSKALGVHTYVVTASDAAGNISTAIITYKAVPDSVLNMNILGYVIENLSSSGLKVSWRTDKIASESLVDFYANGTQLLNQAADMSGTVSSLVVTGLESNRSYVMVLKSKAIGQESFNTLTVPIRTSESDSGLIVNKIESMVGTDPVAGGDFGNGYHFRFFVTANDMTESGVTLRLSDWTNGLSVLPIASNTLMTISANGTDSASGSAVAVTNGYGAFQSISSIDSNPEVGGRQFVIDLFYKIPVGAQGIYGTSYGIKTQ